jgi:hypothetical protein
MTSPASENKPTLNASKRRSTWAELLARPAVWIVLAGVFLAGDYAAGPTIQFPIAFIFPVALAAWHRGVRWGLVFAVAQPVVRFSFNFYWDALWSLPIAGINLLIRVSVLCAFACLVAHAARQRRRITALEGLLPVCAWCKRIRDEHEVWQPLDTYLSRHAELSLTHGICPDCMRKVVQGTSVD